MIGGISLLDDRGDVALGYWVARAHWGQGYATEAARAMLTMARVIGHHRILASHFHDNPASGRVLARLGFRATGEVVPRHSPARGGMTLAVFEPLSGYHANLRLVDEDQAIIDALAPITINRPNQPHRVWA